MEDFRYIPDIRVVRSARSFIQSLCEVYGSSKGMEVWEYIRQGLGDQIAGDIFLGMLIGSDEINVKGFNATTGRFIESIKEVRSFTGMGLKEAKDFLDHIRDVGPKTIKVPASKTAEQVSEFCKNMRYFGCEID